MGYGAEKTTRPRAARLPPEERRRQLVECAVRVFARRGLDAGRHAEVAEEAGVSVPTVFTYFPTREALVEAVLDAVGRFFLDLADRVQREDRPAPEALLAHARAFADSVDTDPDYARIWLNWSSAVREGVWPRYLKLEAKLVERLAENVRRGQREGDYANDVTPEHAARLGLGAAHMIAQLKFSGAPPDEVESFSRTVVRAVGGSLAS